MKTHQKQLWFLFIYFLAIIALFIYLYGFFSVEKTSIEKINEYHNVNFSSDSRTIDKMALIIIDALRYDFVKPQNDENYMPYTLTSILKEESCLTAAKAHSPTVTLPRLKALTSGTISTYIDVIFNFFSSDFKEDNFINLAKSRGYRLVFYGDETWLKLFPKSFMRSEGTHSFFTFDYTEVDNNVTRHLDNEFKRNDWDIIVLHYLGLDHIGHTEGPSSSFVRPKLKEMDEIIRKFAEYFKQLEEKEGFKTLVIVTGDHGMKDSGGHGGVSYPEITVPVVSVGTPCRVLPGWSEIEIPFQIDIASTISALLGLPIPVRNMGKLIPSLLFKMQKSDILKYLLLNSQQLSHLKKIDNDFKLNELSKKTSQLLISNMDKTNLSDLYQDYFHYLDDMSKDLVKSNSDFKLFYLTMGAMGLLINLIVIVYTVVKQLFKAKELIHWFLILGTVFHAFSFLSTSFIEEEHQTWYFLWITFCFLLIFNYSQRKMLNCGRVNWPWITIAILHRFLRKLNQTGDKWASLPDLKFYFTASEGQPYLFPFFILGMGLVFSCSIIENCSLCQLILYGISLLAVIFFRITNGTFCNKYLEFYPKSRGIHEVVVFWTFTSIFTTQIMQGKSSKYLVWLLIASLLLRPHNIILLPFQVFVSKQIHKIFHSPQDLLWNVLAHIWMGNVFYFYQGNGNSLANVDVAAGFVGVQTYIPLYAAIMTTAHTSSGHILAFILSPKSIVVHALVRILPVAIYCTVLISHLHHLFIWSVFSPKLLWETYFTMVLFLLITLSATPIFKEEIARPEAPLRNAGIMRPMFLIAEDSLLIVSLIPKSLRKPEAEVWRKGKVFVRSGQADQDTSTIHKLYKTIKAAVNLLY